MCIACSPFSNALNGRPAASRRGVLRGMGRLALGAGATGFGSLLRCAEAQTPPAASGAADLIYSGGPIITVNDAQPTAEAVAVRGGRILAIGTRDQVQATRGPGTRMVNLEGRTLLPGFVDPHGHVAMVGLQAVGANLLPAPDGEGNDIPALIRILREWAQRNEAAVRRYGLIFGFGYDDSQLREQRHPTRDDLDQVSTEVPVLIIHTSSHLCAANSKALETVGITAATPDPTGGVFRRREGSREPNGVMEENAMIAGGAPLLGGLDEAAWLSMIRAGSEFYASFGYTTCQEGRAMGPTLANLAKAAERGLLRWMWSSIPTSSARPTSSAGRCMGGTTATGCAWAARRSRSTAPRKARRPG